MEGRQTKTGLRVIFTNAQSINNKIDEMRALVAMKKPDILAITETWTNDSIGNSFLEIDGFEIVAREDRRDTEGGRGGGILVYTKKELNVSKEECPTNFNQGVTIRVKCGRDDICIHVIHRSPNSKWENDSHLNEWIKKMRGVNVIIGDLNFPDIDWATGTTGSKGRDF